MLYDVAAAEARADFRYDTIATSSGRMVSEAQA